MDSTKEQHPLNPETIEEPECTNNTEQSDEMSRRQALATLGKFALFTTPVMTTLLTSKKAVAWSGRPPGTPSS
ncbi:MAG: hypothetical protein D3919_15340 [Candidatus Electrothrix sp. AW5]|nr:hypothetical protein [Candidatus Electrothrix gigas]